MKPIIYIVTAAFVIALAFWSYHENYQTRAVYSHADDLRKDIRKSHARLRMLKAEWAYLNRPERLRDLVNFDDERLETEREAERLDLQNITPEQFAMIDQIAYPVPAAIEGADQAEQGALDGAQDQSNTAEQP